MCSGRKETMFMEDITVCTPNEGKSLMIETRDYGRVKSDDYVFISEKVIAICQGRAYDIDELKPRRLAQFLSRFVYQ